MTPGSSDAPTNSAPPGDASRIKILDLPDTSIRITDQPLIRYMKLETFLLLLSGRIFIPTLGLLQSTSDKLESRVPEKSLRQYGEKMRNIVEPHEQWFLRATRGPKVFKGQGPDLKAGEAVLRMVLESIARLVACHVEAL
jgi:hypothetical protein